MKVLLVVYDNDSYISEFPIGLAYIASALRNVGHNITVYNQDQFHYKDEHLTEYLNNNIFDIVCVGVIGGYYQYRKLLKISKAINNSINRPYYIIGGHGPSPDPEFFLMKTLADAVVIGEGEKTIVELINSVKEKIPLVNVLGIAFRINNEITINEKRPLIKDVNSISMPAYDLFPMDYYKLLRRPHCDNSDFILPMISGRGCTFKCNFCYRMDKGFRPRSNNSIIEEIKFLKQTYGITHITFYDDLLMSSEKRTISLCNDFIKEELNIKWDCNGRLNYAKPKILKLMKQSGCVFINYGIEAMDDQILKNMNKVLTTKQIIDGIEATLDVGISPGFNIIFGNIGEDETTLQKGVEFLLKYDDGAQMRTIRPVTPYPGSPLYYYAIEKGLLKDCEDFYENKHINSDLLSVNFTNLSDEDFHKLLQTANIHLIKNYFDKKKYSLYNQIEKLYSKQDPKFRGFRNV